MTVSYIFPGKKVNKQSDFIDIQYAFLSIC